MRDVAFQYKVMRSDADTKIKYGVKLSEREARIAVEAEDLGTGGWGWVDPTHRLLGVESLKQKK